MQRFVLKFLIIFVSMISIMFFSLTFFQQKMMDDEQRRIMDVPQNMDFPPNQEDAPEGPPASIPLLLIIACSSIFVFLILKYIEKNFVTPLNIIEKNIKQIKTGSLDIEFKTESESKNIKETFATLNDMVKGLKQREKLHDNFIQNLVHDLRAPVAAQERAIDILSDELKGHVLIEGMAQNNEAYLKMINQIIEAFRDKEIKIEKIDFDFSKLTDTVISALRPMAYEKGIELVKNVENNFEIWADYIATNRMVMNLVSNAIEHTETGMVTISAKKNEKGYLISIKDTGGGIKEEDIDHIFDKYVSSKNKVVSGLGLSIVKDLTTKQNGIIKAESELGHYTNFIIELPYKDL